MRYIVYKMKVRESNENLTILFKTYEYFIEQTQYQCELATFRYIKNIIKSLQNFIVI